VRHERDGWREAWRRDWCSATANGLAWMRSRAGAVGAKSNPSKSPRMLKSHCRGVPARRSRAGHEQRGFGGIHAKLLESARAFISKKILTTEAQRKQLQKTVHVSERIISH